MKKNHNFRMALRSHRTFPWHSGHRYRLACRRPGFDLAWAHNINFVKKMEICLEHGNSSETYKKRKKRMTIHLEHENSSETYWNMVTLKMSLKLSLKKSVKKVAKNVAKIKKNHNFRMALRSHSSTVPCENCDFFFHFSDFVSDFLENHRDRLFLLQPRALVST